MKKAAFIFSLLLSTISFSQENIEKTIGEFSVVKVYDLINLKMIKSNKNKLVISGKNKNDVEFVNRNGKLKIRMDIKEIYEGNDTVVTLYYTAVDVIDANEGAKVTLEDVIKQYQIEFKTQEGATISAKVKTTYAKFRAVTGGIINVNGKSNNQEISIYTGGVFNGEDFKTEHTEVSVNAAGEAHIYAKEKAEIKIKAGGDVYIYGDPKQVDESRVLGGRIKRM